MPFSCADDEDRAENVVAAGRDGLSFEALAQQTGVKFRIDARDAQLEVLAKEPGQKQIAFAPQTDAEMDRVLDALGPRAMGLYQSPQHEHFASGPLRVVQESPRVYAIGGHEFDLQTLASRKEMLVVHDGDTGDTREIPVRRPALSLNVFQCHGSYLPAACNSLSLWDEVRESAR